MNTKYFAMIALAAMACDGAKDTASGDTGGGGCEPFTGPVALTKVDANCDAASNATFSAEASGLTGDGQVFAMDTANNNPWSETHDLTSFEHDECGAYDHLERTVTTRTYGTATPDTNDWVENSSSFFTCQEHIGTVVMTYAFAIYDETGAFADCWAAGDDASGLIGGAYNGDITNDPDFTLSQCGVGTLGR